MRPYVRINLMSQNGPALSESCVHTYVLNADVIIIHSVEKNSLIYAQLSSLAWAACGITRHCSSFICTNVRPFCAIQELMYDQLT